MHRFSKFALAAGLLALTTFALCQDSPGDRIFRADTRLVVLHASVIDKNGHLLTSLKQDALFNIRNSPILDIINPSLRIQQVQLPDHFNNVNFMRIPRVDRCTTCHVAADRKGYDNPKWNEVLRSHPRLNRMVGSESMHPANTFGCTPCHGGRDRATSFWSAGHSPMTEAERVSWTKKYAWEFDRFNENPVLPLKYVEGGCYRCHASEANFTEAPTLDAGMRMVESLGCWGCHRIEGL